MSQEYDSKVLCLVMQKGFDLYECMSGFKKFKEELASSLLMGGTFTSKEYEHVLKV